jgi:RimJ/RimL family protein N-acetyltransferase
MSWPTLRKASRVDGDTLSFRDAAEADADFILSLRADAEKSRFLSAVSEHVDAQRRWLDDYSKKQGQAYFIIEHLGEPIGTVRLYDAQQDSFCWGSWILREGRPKRAAMESALMVYSYAIDDLGFKSAHFDVRKGNDRVWKFHERLGALRARETELDYFYEMSGASIRKMRADYAKFLPQNVTVSR